MSLLFVNEDSAVVGIEANRFFVKYADGMKKMVPAETLEGITIMGRASYFSKGGKYFGHLQSTGHVNVARQRLQCALYDTPFALELSKRIICSKLKNQMVVLRRYEKSRQNINVSEQLKMLHICRSKVGQCETIAEIMGYEGQGAKAYFDGLSQLVVPEFKFRGRNKRPPRDEFNSMLSLGYSVIMNEIYGKAEKKGLNPYFGFMHRDKEQHPTLASNMMDLKLLLQRKSTENYWRSCRHMSEQMIVLRYIKSLAVGR